MESSPKQNKKDKQEMQSKFQFNLEELMWQSRIKSINELSEITKISRQALAAWKNGTVTRLDLSTLYELCKALECDIDDLIQLKEDGQAS